MQMQSEIEKLNELSDVSNFRSKDEKPIMEINWLTEERILCSKRLKICTKHFHEVQYT